METETAATALSALANPLRLEVFRAIVRAGEGGMAAGDLARAAGLAPSTLSFHLKELEHAGLIAARRQSRFIRYALKVEAMRDLLAFLSDQCCGGRPDVCGFRRPPSSGETQPSDQS